MTRSVSAFNLIPVLILVVNLVANSASAIDPSIVVIAGAPIPDQPFLTYGLPRNPVFLHDGRIVFVSSGSIFEGDGSGLVVRHRQGSPIAGASPDRGVSVDGERFAASDTGDIAFGGWMLGNTNDYGLFASGSFGDLTLVVRQNDPAPGLPVGTRFGSVLDLAVDGIGGLVTRAKLLETPAVSPSKQAVWFRNHFGPLQLLVKEGQIPPGAPAPIAELSATYLNRVGGIAAFATDSTGAHLILVADALGSLRTLVREGDANPAGLTGAKLRVICCGGQPLRGFSWSASGVAFAALLEVGLGGVDYANDSVILASDESGGLRVVAREGDAIPGRPGAHWGQLNSAVMNDRGQIAIFQAYTSYDKELILFDPVAGPIVVARSGQPAPGFPPGTTMGAGEDDYTMPLSLNNAGAVSFKGAVSLVNQFGMYTVARFVRTANGVLSRVVATGDLVHVAPGDDRTIFLMGNGSLDESGNVLLNLSQLDPMFGASLPMATAIYSTPEPSLTATMSIGAVMVAFIARRRR